MGHKKQHMVLVASLTLFVAGAALLLNFTPLSTGTIVGLILLFVGGLGLFLVTLSLKLSVKKAENNAHELARKEAHLGKAQDNLKQNRQQLLLALQTKKISAFKWDLKNEQIEFTHPPTSYLQVFKNRKISLRLLRRFIHPEDRDRAMNELARYLNGAADSFNTDLRIRLQPDEWHWIHVMGSMAERSETGIGKCMIGVIEDISEEKKQESAQQQSQKLEAVGLLAGGIAHDFNNMLQAITGYAEMVQLSLQPDDENYSVIESLIEAANRAQAIAKQLLTFSRANQDSKDNLDVNVLVADIASMLKQLIGVDIELKTELAAKLPYIVGAAGQIEQAIVNLCVNARDACENGGQITIKTKEVDLKESFCHQKAWARPGHFVKISVADNGSGIPAAVQQRIFEPFFTTREVGKGTGLGLAIVYSVIEKHNGFVHLVSEEGQGTEFQLYLPVSEVLSNIKEHSSTKISDNLEGSETILLAEDSELVRNFTGKMLRKAGYEVIFACDGLEAVEQFKTHRNIIDILVFDIVMPNMTGKKAYEEIRKIEPQVPVVFCSGYHEEILDTGFYTDFNGTFLPKPYKTGELLSRIRALLNKQQG